MINFSSFSAYLKFVGAKEFTYKGQKETAFNAAQNRLERIGNVLSRPVILSLDLILCNRRNPLFIAALTITALFAATLFFYPSLFIVTFPGLLAVSLKMTAFTLTQATILGLGLRTLGRLSNEMLMNAWKKHELTPQPIGSLRI